MVRPEMAKEPWIRARNSRAVGSHEPSSWGIGIDGDSKIGKLTPAVNCRRSRTMLRRSWG
jgi:hypothetical protein